jgi:hypothetical protein
MRWQCFATDHEPLLYDRPEEFEEHMKTDHAGSFPEDQLPFIVEISAQPITPTLEHCPFCSETAETLEDHVGQHLREFALHSLPWPGYEEEGSQDGSRLQSDSSSSKRTRETVKEARESLPHFDFENVTESDDIPNTNPGDRLDSYKYLLDIAAQHEPLQTFKLLEDETITNFARNRYEVDSTQALAQRLSQSVPLTVPTVLVPQDSVPLTVPTALVPQDSVPHIVPTALIPQDSVPHIVLNRLNKLTSFIADVLHSHSRNEA